MFAEWIPTSHQNFPSCSCVYLISYLFYEVSQINFAWCRQESRKMSQSTGSFFYDAFYVILLIILNIMS